MATIVTKEAIIAQLESGEEFPILLSDVWEWLGYSRKDNAQRSFLALEMAESIDFIQFLINEETSIKPTHEIKMTVDAFKMWAMQAKTTRGKEVRLYYLQVEREWKQSLSKGTPQITPAQIEAYQFKMGTFDPWATQNPESSQIFLDWQGVQARALNPEPVKIDAVPSPTPEFALPNEAIQEALNGAFLNLNRSGLAMNKLFKFIDRIPTMHGLSDTVIKDLTEALDEATKKIEELQGQRDKLSQMYFDMQEACEKERKKVEAKSKKIKELEANNQRNAIYMRQEIDKAWEAARASTQPQNIQKTMLGSPSKRALPPGA